MSPGVGGAGPASRTLRRPGLGAPEPTRSPLPRRTGARNPRTEGARGRASTRAHVPPTQLRRLPRAPRPRPPWLGCPSP